MAPSSVPLQLLRRVLRVVDEDIRAFGQPPEIAIVLGIARLVVCGVDDRADGCLDAKSEAALRMIQPAR